MVTTSSQTRAALSALARQIAIARRESGRSAQDVAERAGISRKTLSKVEHGDPGVAIGTVFEVATLLGVPLFTEDRRDLAAFNSRLEDRLTLLPDRVRTPIRQVDDGF